MNIKKAFTLGEVLTVFIIIGIIATIAMTTIKPWEKAYKYAYTKIYNALGTSIYNYMAAEAGLDKFPVDASTFCTALLHYMNTSDNATECHGNFLGNNPNLGNLKENPNIRLSNGAWLWIGADQTNNSKKPFEYEQTIKEDQNGNPEETDTVKYYIVYADLNGDRRPNVITYDENARFKKLPDIVAFAVTDKFTVIPFGYPKVDQRYLSAHIMYPITDDENSDEEKPSDSMTYYEALVGAYGKAPHKIITQGVVETYDLENSLPNNNLFKYVNNLDSKYANAPDFDTVMCGDGKTAQQIIGNDKDSHCSIRVFNYN